ncbi:MAG: DVU_1553 family AMP-dependent CoA ligase [Syntrophobacteraceae bacterium]|jgi:phenylacetate-coenzyme A ligase PaaK-like adenylate-forming protein
MEITPLEKWIAGRLADTTRQITNEQIESYKVQKLRETIQWARTRSPIYKQRFAGLTEKELVHPRDLGRFPFTTADELRQNPMRFLCVSQSEVERVVTLQTSATTGDPKRIYFTEEDQLATIDFFRVGMSTLAGPGERVLILLPGERPGSVGDLLARALDRPGAVGIAHGPVRDAGQTLEVMERKRIDALVGIPTHVLSLARLGNGKAAPRSVLLSTDNAPDAIRDELRRLWGCEVYDHYGMTEMGFGGGVECRAHFGYHMRELDLYFEIVDPQTGEPVEEGRLGEIVFTTLNRRAMPLIRYRTGDLSRFLPERCPCGTVLKSLERVKGRVGGQIRLATGRELCMADLDEALFPVEGLLDFSAVLSRAGKQDLLHLEVYVKDDHGERTGKAVRCALQTVPAIRTACEEEKLNFTFDIRANGAVPSRGTAKRTIVEEWVNG